MYHSVTVGYRLYTGSGPKTERWGSIRKHKGCVHREADECGGAEATPCEKKALGTVPATKQLPSRGGKQMLQPQGRPASHGEKKPASLLTVW